MPPSWLAANLAAATWPLGGLVLLGLQPPEAPATAPTSKGRPFATVAEHIGIQLSCIPRLALAYLISEYALGDWRTYATELDWRWVLPIFARNIALVLAVCTVWDFALLSPWSPFRERMTPHKFNPSYPRFWTRNATAPIARDAAWSCVTAAIASAYEVLCRHAWSRGWLAYASVPGAAPGTDGAWWAHVPTILWMASWFYWQNIQFYTIHRAMHRWGVRLPFGLPDPGEWIYRHVHSLHHAARNPTAFSGLAMHPAEGAVYLTAALIPVAGGAHPVVFLYVLFNLLTAAPIGHSGFEAPGGGSQAHWLHHSLVNCNYAENVLPLDWLLGTFAADEADAVAGMQRRGLQQKKSDGVKPAAADPATAPPTASPTKAEATEAGRAKQRTGRGGL